MPFTVVIIDDDPQWHELIAYALRPASDTLTIVGNARGGMSGLALARQERPDIVITDLMMPDLDGVALTRHIRCELPGTRVILISSSLERAYQLMASDSGADAYVSKGVLFDGLLAAVRDVIRRRFSGGSWPNPVSSLELRKPSLP